MKALLDKWDLLEQTFMFEGVADDSIVRERLLDSNTMAIVTVEDDFYISFYNSVELHENYGEVLPDETIFGDSIVFYDIRVALDFLENIEALEA